jgi:spermidine synthase
MLPAEKVLLARHSAFTPIRVTEDRDGVRTLRFGDSGTRQSVVKVDDPTYLGLAYSKVMPLSLGFIERPKRILVVGLGGGALPVFFHTILPEAKVDIVELDEDVVRTASEFCGFVQDQRMRVSVEDGRDFIEGCAGAYDLIVLDAFDADSVPRHLLTEEFLQAVKSALNPDGAVVSNVWGPALNRLYSRILATYRHVFDPVFILDVPNPGTKVFIGLSRACRWTAAELVQRMAAVPVVGGSEVGRLRFRHSDLEYVPGAELIRDP